MSGMGRSSGAGFDFGKFLDRFNRFDATLLSQPTSQLLNSPGDFFANLRFRPTEDAVFYFACIVIATTLLDTVVGSMFHDFQGARLVVFPLMMTVSMIVGALFYHLLMGLLLGGKGALGDAVKVVCFTYLTQIVAWIPWISLVGVLVGFIWLTVAAIETYQVEPTRAKVAGLLLGGLVLLLSFNCENVAANKRKEVQELIDSAGKTGEARHSKNDAMDELDQFDK